EPVTAFRYGFDIPGLIGRVNQSRPDLANGGIQGEVEVHEGVRPDLVSQFVPGDNLAVPLQKNTKHPKALLLQTHPDSALGQLSGAQVQSVDAESHNAGWSVR